MTNYEKIKSVSNDVNDLAEVLYAMASRYNLNPCLYCEEPSGAWCIYDYCINAMVRMLTELEYEEDV